MKRSGFFKTANTLYNWKTEVYASLPTMKYVVYPGVVRAGVEISIFVSPLHNQLKSDVIRLQRNERS